MAWLIIVLAIVGVVVIGLVAVGGVTQRMAALPPERVFDLDECVHWVAEALPDDLTAQLSYEDVQAMIEFHLDYLESLGVARDDSVPEVGEPGEWAAEGDGPRIADDNAALAYVLGQLTGAERDVTDAQAAAVVELTEDYLRAIGALGAAVPDPKLIDDADAASM